MKTMTLYRQLLATMLLLFGLLFLASYWVQFNSTRSYLAQQQETTVINTATSLGLALTPYLETGDKVGAESVIKAVFDGGYYRQIRLDLLASNNFIELNNTTNINGVPSWFVGMKIFPDVSHESVLTSGWLQLGKLRVVGHPGQAYYELWAGMSELASWFLVGFLVTALLLMRALHYLLRPLEQIRKQAVEIELHHFGHSIPLPRTFELRQVVQAINTLSSKLAGQFKEQAEEAEKLRERAYLDAVSGLGNRAYFVSQVNAWIAESGQGGLFLIAVDLLDDIYREEGFSARDNMVKSIATILKELIQVKTDSAIARISATEYAVLYPTTEKNELLTLADKINERIMDLVVNPIDEGHPLSVIGVVIRECNEDLPTLLTKADNALGRARNERRGAIVVSGDDSTNVMGRMAWRDLVQEAIRDQLLRFKAQPACRFGDGAIIHEELFTFIHKNEQDFFASQFMPAIEQFKMGCDFDQAVLTMACDILARHTDLHLAINLMPNSIVSEDFIKWIDGLLDKKVSLKERLVFEIPESVIMKHQSEVSLFVKILKDKGFSWGVDYYGRHFHSLGYLELLLPSYVKVDHGYTSQILEEGADTAFLAAVCRTARNVGATTIATRVESDAQVQALAKLHIDGYQGFVRAAHPLS